MTRVYTFKANYWSKDDLLVNISDSARAGLAISLVANRYGNPTMCSEALEKLSLIPFRERIGYREYREVVEALEALLKCLTVGREPKVVRLDA